MVCLCVCTSSLVSSTICPLSGECIHGPLGGFILWALTLWISGKSTFPPHLTFTLDRLGTFLFEWSPGPVFFLPGFSCGRAVFDSYPRGSFAGPGLLANLLVSGALCWASHIFTRLTSVCFHTICRKVMPILLKLLSYRYTENEKILRVTGKDFS